MSDNLLERLDKTKIDLLKIFVTAAKVIFDNNADITSFGWQQITAYGTSYEKKFGIFTTRNSPKINAADARLFKGFQEVVDFLAQFSTDLLVFIFGIDCSITINKDLTYKVEYDN